MLAKEFDALVDNEHEASKDMLLNKSIEYATDKDRLSNFKLAAGIRGVNPADALVGMVVEHWVSISDMAKHPTMYTMEKWLEKLRDDRNYTYLLTAILVDLGVK
jgi:hypothetical protein